VGDPNFADPGGFDFACSNGHFVGGAIGGGYGYLPTPPYSYLMWSTLICIFFWADTALPQYPYDGPIVKRC
jgi:hypothetical protein